MSFAKNTFRKWWSSLTAAQKREVARRCKTTVNYLQQIAGGHRTLSVEMAQRVGDVALPDAPECGEVHPTCAKCNWYLAERGG